MKRLIIAGLIAVGVPGPASALECAKFWSWVEKGRRHVVDTYQQGGNSLLVSGFDWHIPATWTPEARARENEKAWGAGWARSREQLNGDTENVFLLVFSDSHRHAQYNLGYSWTTYWGAREGLQPGLGYTAAIIKRPDIANGWPVPVVLPLFTLRYQNFELLSTYIPTVGGGVNHGSVLYIFGKIDLK
ncbi:MAG TPA: hypothetical protein VGK75_04175 [Casimicrobiaceae bacterium]